MKNTSVQLPKVLLLPVRNQWSVSEKKVASPYFEVMIAVSKWFDVIWSVLNRAWSWVDTVVYWKVLFENSSKTLQSSPKSELNDETYLETTF